MPAAKWRTLPRIQKLLTVLEEASDSKKDNASRAGHMTTLRGRIPTHRFRRVTGAHRKPPGNARHNKLR